MMTEKQAQKDIKRERVPVGGTSTNLQLSERDLKVMEEMNKVPRWFNDNNGRVERAKAGGYEFVTPEYAKSVGGDGLENGRVSKVVSRTGNTVRAYLMWIDKEFFDEDQRAKAQRNMQVDFALQAVGKGGQTIESGYTPKSA